MIRNRLGASTVLVYPKLTIRRLLLVLFKFNLLKESGRVAERYLEISLPGGIKRGGRIRNFFMVPAGIPRRLKRTCLKDVGSRFIAVCKEGDRIVLLGEHPDDSLKDLERSFPGRFVNLTAKLDIIEAAAVIGISRLFITNDTGLMHIADAMKKKTISIWGPTVFEFGFNPMSPTTKVVANGKIRCRPCSLHGSVRCPLGHFRCMSTIVLSKIAGLVTQR
jgi:heptosyltransferase-2